MLRQKKDKRQKKTSQKQLVVTIMLIEKFWHRNKVFSLGLSNLVSSVPDLTPFNPSKDMVLMKHLTLDLVTYKISELFLETLNQPML